MEDAAFNISGDSEVDSWRQQLDPLGGFGDLCIQGQGYKISASLVMILFFIQKFSLGREGVIRIGKMLQN